MFIFLKNKKGFTPTQENGVVPRAFFGSHFLVGIKEICSMSFSLSKRHNKNASPFFCAGFSLIEAIVAIGVISVGFVGSLVLISKSSSQSTILKDRVVAAHLAEEGIEVVYNIRDTNWLKGLSWLTDIPDTTNGIINYNSTSVDTSDNSESRKCLNWNGSVYMHAVGPSYACTTSFKRHIEIETKTETINGNNISYIEVKSIVSWKEKNATKSLTVIDHLYDWK